MTGDKSNTTARGYFDRLIQLEHEKQNIQSDIKEVFAEAKEDPDCDIDTKVLRRAVKIAIEAEEAKRKRIALDTDAQRFLMEIGAVAEAMAGTPMGDYAKKLGDDIRAGRADLKVGDQPWVSEQIGEGMPAK